MAGRTLFPVDPPPFTGVEPFGLLSAAIIIDNVSSPALGGVVYPYRCDPATDTWPGPCVDVPLGQEKSRPGGVDMIEGQPFAVYGFETCPLAAYTEAQLAARARESLQRGEQHVVERALWMGRGDHVGFIDRDAQVLVNEPVSIVDATALAEYWLGLRDGRGMLHINPIAAALARNAEVASAVGNIYFTPMGHRWVFGGGYPLMPGPTGNTAATAANTAWMFVTRQITIRRSAISVISGFRGQSNEHDSRAERIYVPVIPCEIAAIPVATVVDTSCNPIAPPVPGMTLSVTPQTGPAPLEVTAVASGETGDVTFNWGD